MGDISTEPHHRFELVDGGGEPSPGSRKALESRTGMLIAILLRAEGGEGVAKVCCEVASWEKRFLALAEGRRGG